MDFLLITLNGKNTIHNYSELDLPNWRHVFKFSKYSSNQIFFEISHKPAILALYYIYTLYMASSVNRQDELNHTLSLATWVGSKELSCPLGITRPVPQEKFPWKPNNKSFIDQAFLVKMTFLPKWYTCIKK